VGGMINFRLSLTVRVGHIYLILLVLNYIFKVYGRATCRSVRILHLSLLVLNNNTFCSGVIMCLPCVSPYVNSFRTKSNK
jgi:hypothetical protein